MKTAGEQVGTTSPLDAIEGGTMEKLKDRSPEQVAETTKEKEHNS
jgi:hypothetical protein